MKKIILSSPIMFLLVLTGAPVQALEPFALLDDFSGDRIDKSLWNGSQRPDVNVLDAAREVQGGELRLMNRSFGRLGAPGFTLGRVRMFLNNSAPVTQMLALVRVNAVALSGCTGSINISRIFGRLGGYFFTTGGPPAPLDASRNIFADIRIQRQSDSIDPPGVMQVAVAVFFCNDATCNSTNTLLFNTTSLGTIIPGQPTLLALVWDPDNDRFLFARDSVAQLVVYNYNGILTDTDPPSSDLSFVHKRVSVRAGIENCTSGPVASGLMDLSIDKLWVNQSAVSP
jgi:hypothetical protein